MLLSTLTVLVAVAAKDVLAGYVLADDYMATDFFDQFSFWDTSDPTNGFVAYQSQDSAQTMGLINGTTGDIYMGVDSTNVTPDGRPSVRITSTKSYNYGLFVVDLEHMPGGICGTWPAFWTVGPDWPYQGEIDILEGINEQLANLQTLHTGPSCSITNNGDFSGSLTYTSCDSTGSDNTGCQIAASSSESYGSGFNANGGGVYAMEWTSSSINIWFFPRSSIPSDALGDAPDPTGWGTPVAVFQGDCDISTSFMNQQIVFDTTFCGDWAGDDWSTGSCAAEASTCDAYVQDNPAAFVDAYWSINALKVYQEGTAASTSAPAESATSAPYFAPSVSVSLPLSIPSVSLPLDIVPVTTVTNYVYTTAATTPGYVPVVAPAVPTEISAGYAPVVGLDGTVGFEAAAAPWPTGGEWSTEDGVADYSKEKKRSAKHLGHHRRHGGARI